MVRHLLQGRVGKGLGWLRLPAPAGRWVAPLIQRLAPLLRWAAPLGRWLAQLLRWLAARLQGAHTAAQVAIRVAWLALHPADPNNLFVASGEGALHRPEAGRRVDPGRLPQGPRRRTRLDLGVEGTAEVSQEAGQAPVPAGAPGGLAAVSLTLAGVQPPDLRRVDRVIRQVNHRFALADLLATEVRRLQGPAVDELDVVIRRLARRWLDLDEQFTPVERRTRLDVRRTLQRNLPRYGGYVLRFFWRTKELPVPQLVKPARLLVIGDVSHSMCHYVTVCLFFFHRLNFLFDVDSWVFSERASRATLFLKRPGSFADKLRDLAQHAASWNAGTRFGSSLEQILAHARIDPYTHVVIATDGKVALGGGEYEKIHRCLTQIRARARSVIFMTPEAAFARSYRNQAPVEQVGSFKAGTVDIPIFDLGQIWYRTLGRYADRVYHVRTVQDLVDMCEDLYRSARD